MASLIRSGLGSCPSPESTSAPVVSKAPASGWSSRRRQKPNDSAGRAATALAIRMAAPWAATTSRSPSTTLTANPPSAPSAATTRSRRNCAPVRSSTSPWGSSVSPIKASSCAVRRRSSSRPRRRRSRSRALSRALTSWAAASLIRSGPEPIQTGCREARARKPINSPRRLRPTSWPLVRPSDVRREASSEVASKPRIASNETSAPGRPRALVKGGEPRSRNRPATSGSMERTASITFRPSPSPSPSWRTTMPASAPVASQSRSRAAFATSVRPRTCRPSSEPGEIVQLLQLLQHALAPRVAGCGPGHEPARSRRRQWSIRSPPPGTGRDPRAGPGDAGPRRRRPATPRARRSHRSSSSRSETRRGPCLSALHDSVPEAPRRDSLASTQTSFSSMRKTGCGVLRNSSR